MMNCAISLINRVYYNRAFYTIIPKGTQVLLFNKTVPNKNLFIFLLT